MLAGMMRKLPVMPVIGKGEYRLQPVYIDDLCGIVARAISDNFTYGKTFDIGGPEILTYMEIVDLVGKIIGKRIFGFHQPVFFMRLLAAIFDRFPWFPVTRDQITMLYDESHTDDNRLFDRYGVAPRKLTDALGEYL
jgi:NADH dehydrogenase